MLLSEFKKKYTVENYSKIAPTNLTHGTINFGVADYNIEIAYGFEYGGTCDHIKKGDDYISTHDSNYGGIKLALDKIDSELSKLL